MASISTTGHSAIVHITLQVGETILPVAQLGPNFLILAQPASLPPSQGTVTLEVDGRSKVFPVHLPLGIKGDARRVIIEKPTLQQPAAA